MKAVQLTAYGRGAEGLEVRDLPEPPEPGPGEALVAVEFSPINGNDLMVVAGVYDWRPELPATIGNEGAGKVLALGPGVVSVRVGQRVVLPFMGQTWRERMIARADDLVPVPDDVDPGQAAMMAINPVTASLLLDDFVDLAAGDAIAFNIAASGLGRWLAGLARRRGIRTVGLVRRQESAEQAAAAGCEFTVLDDEDIEAAAARLADLDIRLALDGVGGPATSRLIRLLRPGGKLVAFGGLSRKPMEVASPALIFKRVSVEGFFEGYNKDRVVPALRDLVELAGAAELQQPIAAVYPISDIKGAVAHAARGGRVLLDLSSTAAG